MKDKDIWKLVEVLSITNASSQFEVLKGILKREGDKGFKEGVDSAIKKFKEANGNF